MLTQEQLDQITRLVNEAILANFPVEVEHMAREKAVGAGAMAHGQAAIRPDDAISGVLIYGNVFVRASRGRFGAVQMNSGRDNIIANNLVIECAQGITGGWNAGNGAWQELRASKPPPDFITSALYLSRYPAMAAMLTTPGNNYAWRNVFYRSGATGDPGNIDYGQRDPGFVDAAKGDWRLKPDAAPYGDIGFRPIPMEEIGLYQDTNRSGLPANAKPER
jgi:hypothetical protein